ncbi:MAG: hypothetical protein LC700_00310 [Actinobacteria bacterium]|nr:hypothetical protein [Actinomycetota bacterium]
MSTPDPTPGRASSGPPPAPWIPLDRTTVDQAAAALARLERWLASGDPAATAQCAHALSGGEDDPVGVARWVGTLAARLRTRIEEADSWS